MSSLNKCVQDVTSMRRNKSCSEAINYTNNNIIYSKDLLEYGCNNYLSKSLFNKL